MAGTTKLMTAGGGGVNLTPASSIASDVTVNLPTAVNGATLAVNGPAFSAYSASTPTSVPNATFTKTTCDTENFDTNGNFNVAQSRFTPTVAGYYQVNLCQVLATPSANAQFNSYIYKNGATTNAFSQDYTTTGASLASTISVLVEMNGTTDYIEPYAFQISGASQNISVSSFSACLVRSA